MIQPQLLAIGNIVQYKNLKGRVNLIKQDPTYGYWAIGFASLSRGFGCIEDPKEFTPVLLDEKTLKCCGFKTLSNCSIPNGELFSKGNFLYSIYEGLYFGPHSLPPPKIQYLHELQNEYKSLTGQELEIKL